MKLEKENDYNNCLSVEMSENDSDESISVYQSLNEDFLRDYICRIL